VVALKQERIIFSLFFYEKIEWQSRTFVRLAQHARFFHKPDNKDHRISCATHTANLGLCFRNWLIYWKMRKCFLRKTLKIHDIAAVLVKVTCSQMSVSASRLMGSRSWLCNWSNSNWLCFYWSSFNSQPLSSNVPCSWVPVFGSRPIKYLRWWWCLPAAV